MSALQIISQVEARAKGLKRYFTGKPCAHGHIAERTVPWGSCVACVAVNDERARRWRQQARDGQVQLPRRAYRRLGEVSPPKDTFGFDKDPLPWPDDGGAKRVPIYDRNGREPRLVRRVGWVKCLSRVMTHRWFSPDVVKCRVCEFCRGREPHPNFDHLGL